MPARSLLMRKLVQMERLLRPPAEQQAMPATPADSKQQARAARKATADAYLSAVSAAAARQDIQSLLQQLSTAAAAAAAVPAPGTTQQQQQHMPWLLPAGLTVAARQLATGPGGRPQFAQALVELVLDQGIVEPQRAQRAVHAVLQAYYDAGDYSGVLAAAARFFDIDTSSSRVAAAAAAAAADGAEATDSSSSSRQWSLKPSSVTLALLLDAAAAQGDAALLLGVWKYFGAGTQVQQQQQHGSSSSSSSSKTAASRLPPPVALHALSHGAVLCDLASQASEGTSSSSSSSSSSSRGVFPVLFTPDSCTVDVLYQLHRLATTGQQQQHHQDAAWHASQQSWQQDQARQLQAGSSSSSSSSRGGRSQRHKVHRQLLPLPLLHPQQASKLLGLCSSAADVDLLLLSQLYQPGGLGVADLISLQQRLQDAAAVPASNSIDSRLEASSSDPTASSNLPAITSSTSSSSSSLGWALGAGQGPLPLRILDDLPAVSATTQPPAFPPPLRADVAYAAVAAYLRTGAFGRAAAVAHAAAVKHPKDIQQFHLLIQGAAAAGAALPGLVLLDKLRDSLWQVATPTAQAAMIRTLAKAGASPPLGAAPSAARLSSFFSRHCTPHPNTWGALLQGLVIAGDRGHRTLKALRAAMSQPYNYLSLSGFSAEALDRARSRIVAALLRGILAAPEQQSRLADLSAAAAAALQQGGSGSVTDSQRSSSGGSNAAAEPQGSMRLHRSGLMAALDVSPAAAKQAAVLNATALANTTSDGSSNQLPQDGSHTWGASISSISSSSAWLPSVEQAAPGLPLQQQPVHTRLKVVVLLQILQVLRCWGVRLQHDAALAAALQVLRFCWDTEDARQSGLLVEVLRASLELGIQPSTTSLRALLACCADLESRPGKTPLGLASGPGFELGQVGYVDLGQVLQACREALQEQEGPAAAQPASVSAHSSAGRAGASAEAQRQLAAQLLRTWVFNSTFAYVEGVRAQGPAFPLRGDAAGSGSTAPELSAAVGA